MSVNAVVEHGLDRAVSHPDVAPLMSERIELRAHLADVAREVFRVDDWIAGRARAALVSTLKKYGREPYCGMLGSYGWPSS